MDSGREGVRDTGKIAPNANITWDPFHGRAPSDPLWSPLLGAVAVAERGEVPRRCTHGGFRARKRPSRRPSGSKWAWEVYGWNQKRPGGKRWMSSGLEGRWEAGRRRRVGGGGGAVYCPAKNKNPTLRMWGTISAPPPQQGTVSALPNINGTGPPPKKRWVLLSPGPR